MTASAAVRPVVVGVDGSDDSLAALRWAADEARRRQVPLWVVHAFDTVRAGYEGPQVGAERRAAEEMLDAAARQAREPAGGVEVRAVLEAGAASVVLLRQSTRADLVVEKDEQAALAESVAVWRGQYPGVDVVEKIVLSVPGKALVDESAGAALLVVGSHGRGGFGGLQLGSVGHSALHYAHCPVAVVRH